MTINYLSQLELLLELLAEKAGNAVNADGTDIEILSDTDFYIVAATGIMSRYAGMTIPLANTYTKKCIEAQKPLVCGTAEEVEPNSQHLKLQGTESLATFPVYYHSKIVAVFKILAYEKNKFTEEDDLRLDSLLTKMGDAVVAYTQAKAESSDELTPHADYEKSYAAMMAAFAEKARISARGEGSALEIIDGEDMVYHSATGMLASRVGLRLPRDDSYSGLAADQRATVSCQNADEAIYSYDLMHTMGIGSMLITPVVLGNTAVAVIKVVSTEKFHFTEIDRMRLESIADLAATTIASYRFARGMNDDFHPYSALTNSHKTV